MTAASSVNIVVVGHVDHGKSTFLGRLLKDIGYLSQDRINDATVASQAQGRRFEYAFLLDQFQEEREANITIDTTQFLITMNGQSYLLIDAPGHKEYLKNMVTGANEAHHALLLLDVKEGIREQTDKHARLLKLLGIRRLGVLINKMDLVNYDEASFLQAEKVIREQLQKHKILSDVVIPIVAYEGENIVHRSPKFSWYKGPTALDFIFSCTAPEESQNANSASLFPVQLRYGKEGDTLILGRLEQGTLMRGQELVSYLSQQKVQIKKILQLDKDCAAIEAGENCALLLSTDYQFDRGEVFVGKGASFKRVLGFHAPTFWAHEQPLVKGMEVQLECKTQMGSAFVKRIFDDFNETEISSLGNGDVGTVEFSIVKPIFVDRDGFSRIVLHLDGHLVGCSVISDIKNANQ